MLQCCPTGSSWTRARANVESVSNHVVDAIFCNPFSVFAAKTTGFSYAPRSRQEPGDPLFSAMRSCLLFPFILESPYKLFYNLIANVVSKGYKMY